MQGTGEVVPVEPSLCSRMQARSVRVAKPFPRRRALKWSKVRRMVLLPAFTCEVPFMLRRGVRKDRRRDRDSPRCVPIRGDGASEAGRASQSAVGRFTSRTPSFHCSGGDAGENWNRCESPGGGSAHGALIRRRDQQNPVHRETVQGLFKEARVDEERANNQDLTQKHVDHLVSPPYRARSCGTAVTITLGVKRSAAGINGVCWLWRRFCHHWTGMISGRITSGTAPRRDQRPDRSAPYPATQWHSSAVPTFSDKQ